MRHPARAGEEGKEGAIEIFHPEKGGRLLIRPTAQGERTEKVSLSEQTNLDYYRPYNNGIVDLIHILVFWTKFHVCERDKKGYFLCAQKAQRKEAPSQDIKAQEGDLAGGRGVETVGPLDGLREKKEERPRNSSISDFAPNPLPSFFSDRWPEKRGHGNFPNRCEIEVISLQERLSLVERRKRKKKCYLLMKSHSIYLPPQREKDEWPWSYL